MDKRLDVFPMAQEITQCIIKKEDHRFIRWNKEKTSCTVLTAVAIPFTNQQTTTARRRRLRSAINNILISIGMTISNKNKVFLP